MISLPAAVAGSDSLLSIDQAADWLGTTSRFPRRLIAERRIRYIKVGRHVRIPASALVEFLACGTVEPGSTRAELRRPILSR
jgi:excisionase family DNA binding protein